MNNEYNSRSGGVGSVGCLVVLFVIGLVAYLIYGSVKDSMPSDEQMAASKQKTEQIIQTKIPPSIIDMDEVDWVEYDGNDVYVGINKVPSDLKTMINAWAIQANQALGRGVHVWAVHNAPKGWRPGDQSDGFYNATARDGVIK